MTPESLAGPFWVSVERQRRSYASNSTCTGVLNQQRVTSKRGLVSIEGSMDQFPAVRLARKLDSDGSLAGLGWKAEPIAHGVAAAKTEPRAQVVSESLCCGDGKRSRVELCSRVRMSA